MDKTVRRACAWVSFIIPRTRSAIWFLLMVTTASSNLLANSDGVTIDPPHPRAGEPVFATVRGGQCVALFSDFPGEASRALNDIRLLVPGAYLGSDACIAPEHARSFPLGGLPKGKYRLAVYFHDPFDDDDVPASFGEVEFSVGDTFAVPSALPAGLTVLGVGIVALSLDRLGRRRAVLRVALPLCMQVEPASASKSVHVLLRRYPTIVSDEDIVHGYGFSPGLPPALNALNVSQHPADAGARPMPKRRIARRWLGERPEQRARIA